MAKATCRDFRVTIGARFAPDGNSRCTGIIVEVPAGLTRQQAIDYVTGVVAREVSRYAAAEALGLTVVPQTRAEWEEIVT